MAHVTAEERWDFFASRGPIYSMPLRREWLREGLPDFAGSLHVALYPRRDLLGLTDFELWQRYSSSIQQTLIETGEIESAEFFPETAKEALANFARDQRTSRARRQPADIRAELRELGLPRSLEWLLALDFEEWLFFRDERELAISAATTQGFLTMFIVDDT